MCDMDCLNCIFEDCTNDSDLTDEEIKQADDGDKYAKVSRLYGKELRTYRYEQSERRKESHMRYDQSEKGKERFRRYGQSAKGKATEKRKMQKRIASGKNAEYCRRYYQRKKAEREALANAINTTE